MIGRKQELNLQFLQIVDGLLIALAFWGGHTIRLLGSDTGLFGGSILPFSEFEWVLFVAMPFGPIILELHGFYLHPMQSTTIKAATRIIRSAFWLGLLIAVCAYFLRLQIPSRAVMPLFGVLATGLLLLRERVTTANYRKRAKIEALREPVILAGTKEDIRQLRRTFTPEQIMEIEVMEEFDVEQQPVSDLVTALHTHSVSRVIFAGGHSHLIALQEAIAACEIEGVEAWLVADFIRTSIARPAFDVFGNRPMLVFRTTPDISWALIVKGFIDRSVALLGLVLASPLLGAIALGIKLTSPGPIFFQQLRGGKNGRPFTMHKFRSMDTDAEHRQKALAQLNQMSGPVFKIDNDPRVTPIGKFLRKTSLDELPQLLNILQGDMSLVGPRPLPIYEVEKFESTAQRRRLSMKPGLTCLWQISGRSEVKCFDQWVKLDLEYIDNWSLLLDLIILLKTIPVVLFRVGAR